MKSKDLLAAPLRVWNWAQNLDVNYFILALIPALLYWVNSEWFFTSSGWLDPWMYTGYFWHYPDHIPYFEGYYKASRLPWLLIGYVIHQIWEAVTAHVVLHFSMLLGTAFGVYSIVRLCVSPGVALLSAALWLAFPFNHGVGGWDYHNVGANFFFVWSLYFWFRWIVAEQEVRASGSSWPRLANIKFAALAGGLFTLAVHTNLFIVGFLPIFGLYHLFPISLNWRHFLVEITCLLSTAFLVTVLFGYLNWASGGNFLFYQAQINYTRAISKSNAWHVNWSEWIGLARWLVLPALVSVLALLKLAMRTERPLVNVLLSQLVYIFLFMIYWELKGQTILNPAYMCSPLFTPTFLGLGALLAQSQHLEKLLCSFMGRLVVLAVALMPFWLSADFFLIERPPVFLFQSGALALGALCLFWGSRSLVQSASLIGRRLLFMMALLCWIPANFFTLHETRAAAGYLPGHDCSVGRDLLSLFRDMDRFVAAHDPALGTRFWFIEKSLPGERRTGCPELNPSAIFDSFVSTRLWLGNLWPSHPMKPVGDLQRADFEGSVGKSVAILAFDKDLWVSVAKKSQAAGFLAIPVASRFFHVGQFQVHMDILKFEHPPK